MKTDDYRLVQLANGVWSVHSTAHAETFHPVVGPEEEAQALYVRQLRLGERIAQSKHEFVIWDVGLGAAANPISVLRATQQCETALRIVSFDHTLEPLRFAIRHSGALAYLHRYLPCLERMLNNPGQAVTFQNGVQPVTWEVVLGDFPTVLASEAATAFSKPHAVLFDAFSPATNPAMWTQPLFARLFDLLDSARPCAMPTYSRSTMLRVTLLLAGFYVGKGHATGEKEETTIAANTLDLVDEPLRERWLKRARASRSAEPLWTPSYRQAPLTEETWERLRRHRQFAITE